jgi:hypothetical protein
MNIQVAQLAQLTALPVVMEEEVPPVRYVTPIYPPRQDRN